MAVHRSSSLGSSSVDLVQEKVETFLTDRYQTTVPQPVRRVLELGKRDRIRPDLPLLSSQWGRASPALAPFLALLEQDRWLVYVHLSFLDQLEALMAEVEKPRRKDPQGYGKKNASKRLTAITRLMLHDIPQDPDRKEFQQGSALGAKHWH